MGGWISDLIHGFLDTLAGAFNEANTAALNWVLGILSSTVFSSPDVTGVPQVAAATGQARLVANAVLVLVVMIVAFQAMTLGSIQDRYTLKELLPRMLLGFLAANMATPLIRAATSAANALTQALAGDKIDSVDAIAQVQQQVLSVTPGLQLFVVVLQTLTLWMLIAVLFTWLGRITILMVLAATAPVALLCHALPQTDPVARIWWRTLVGVLVVPILQAVTLHIAVLTLVDKKSHLPFLHDPSGILNLLATCFVLWLVIRIPRWVSRNLGGNNGRGASVLGNIVRVVVVQQLLGAVGLRGAGALLGRRGAPLGPRPPAMHIHDHFHTGTHQHLHVHPPRPSSRPRPGGQAGPGGPAGSAGSGGPPPMRVRSWRDQNPSARPHPGRPPRALEG